MCAIFFVQFCLCALCFLCDMYCGVFAAFLLSHKSCTWDVHRDHRARYIAYASDAQLAVKVVSPALDCAPGHEHTRVGTPSSDGDGGDAWKEGQASGVRLGKSGLRLPFVNLLLVVCLNFCDS
jgi:hypothetical protein